MLPMFGLKVSGSRINGYVGPMVLTFTELADLKQQFLNVFGTLNENCVVDTVVLVTKEDQERFDSLKVEFNNIDPDIPLMAEIEQRDCFTELRPNQQPFVMYCPGDNIARCEAEVNSNNFTATYDLITLSVNKGEE